MAPSYRNSNRRQNRTGVVDHDVFEGLPVRQWRRDYVTVVPPPSQENTSSQNDIWAVELPHGMPKDSHLLPQHSQDLLRAARSGKIYKRPAPVEEEEADPEVVLGDKPEKKEEDPKDKGFTAKAWKQIPRHAEAPDSEYLAKRRKGLVTAASRVSLAGTLTKTKVKRIDAAGNEYVQDVVAPHGQKVEGEVISQTIIPDPGVVTDPYAIQPTPSKKKGAAARKKTKGPGRGRKKKVVAPTSVPEIVTTAPVEAVPGQPVAQDGIKIEESVAATPSNNEDTEMGDGSMAASDDEDEGEEGEEGEEEENSTESQNSPSKVPRIPSPTGTTLPSMKAIPSLSPANSTGGIELGRPPTIHIERDVKFGSPLKNVALTQSTLTSPLESPTVAKQFPDLKEVDESQTSSASPTQAEPTSLDQETQQETIETAPTTLPPPPPEPTEVEVKAAVEVRQEEEEEEEMLLDIVEKARHGEGSAPAADTATSTSPEIRKESPMDTEAEASKQLSMEANVEHPPVTSEGDKPAEGEDDDFPDLLGGLEKSLQKKPDA